MLRYDMMDSPAWLALSANAQALWVHIRRRYNGDNNGDIPLSCREAAEKLNIGKTSAAAAFDELTDKGFIKIGKHSDFRLKAKKSRRWIMTHETLDGKAPTNEWREWGKDKANMPFPDSQKGAEAVKSVSGIERPENFKALSESV